jgi:hypothetical protein
MRDVRMVVAALLLPVLALLGTLTLVWLLLRSSTFRSRRG